MISCETARELLLEAEPGELRGEGDGPLAAHLRGCPACRQRAAYVIKETDRLHRAIDALPLPLHAAASGSGGEAAPRRWPVLVPLALAAGVAALVLVRRHDVTAPSTPLRVARAIAPPLDVQVPAGQSVAVFQTANPNIVVIWSY